MSTSRDDFIIAIRSALLQKGNKQRFSLLGLMLFSIVFLTLGSINYKPINYIKIAIKEIVYTSSFIISIPESFIGNTYTDVSDHFIFYDKHQKLKNELEILKSKDINNQILFLENTKYKKLIDDYFVKDNETFAKVLIDKQSPFLRSIVINKGSKNNVKLGMVVLDENYLIGKVVEVNYFTSRVLLISDINSKIPVSLQPGDLQAIMSGKDKQEGILQYIKNKNFKNENEEFFVLTSGAGGVFKSGIPIGKIINEEDASNKGKKIVIFYKDFSQLKYVKVVSYLKETKSLDLKSKKDSKKLSDKIIDTKKKESLGISLEQRKITDEVRSKIEKENNILKKKIIKLQNEILVKKNIIKENTIDSKEKKFLQLNLLYGHKCRKTLFNDLFKVTSEKYRSCVLTKGKKN